MLFLPSFHPPSTLQTAMYGLPYPRTDTLVWPWSVDTRSCIAVIEVEKSMCKKYAVDMRDRAHEVEAQARGHLQSHSQPKIERHASRSIILMGTTTNPVTIPPSGRCKRAQEFPIDQCSPADRDA
ncbi:hypothetical protein VTL71DRAFT_8578 [Oculimacula yallundae]|uniref:Uncharacterized protein n=1 Tax=Oculimacula yallundae TaxID=86028 RepID=A0ABR4CY31_9HELO